MSAAPDPAELAPSRDPAAYGRRPLFTPRFFAWAGVCAACLIAGALVGRFGFAPANPAAESEPALEAPTHAPANTAPLTPSLATLGAPINAATAPVVASADVSALSGRVARLEGGAAGLDASAAEALAAASLSDAAAGSAPFDQDLAAYERVAPPSPELRALEPLAARGAPSRAELAAAFPALASEAAAAARTPRKGASLLDRLVAALGKVVIVRNIDPSAGGVDGLLARAEHAALAGDLAAALRDIDALPPRARATLAEWTGAAERRIEIDRHIAAVRAGALTALAASGGQSGALGGGQAGGGQGSARP
jgi:hypothetical protein